MLYKCQALLKKLYYNIRLKFSLLYKKEILLGLNRHLLLNQTADQSFCTVLTPFLIYDTLKP